MNTISDEKIIRAIREESLKDMLREEERRIQKRQKTIKMLVSALAVAAVLVVGIFVLKAKHQPDYSVLADTYIAQLDDRTISRGDNDVADRYFAIISSLKNNEKNVLSDIEAFYNYVADSEELDPDEKDFYTINMYFFEALAHLRDNDRDKAEPLLRKVSESQSKYAEMAKKIEESLEKRE